jgi:serine/threonine protein kinase
VADSLTGGDAPTLLLASGAEPLPGYRLLDQLGKGGFGEVWKAEGPGGVHVALKFVRLLEPAGAVEQKALAVIKRIRHPHLLTLFGVWQLGDWLVIGMDLADRSLLDRFREAVPQGNPGIPEPELLEYMLDAAKGLDFLNEPRHPSDGTEPQGIQHRDVKPHNLLLVGGSVKVADFGLARLLEHSLTGHTGSMTPAYAAPEFFDGRTSAHSDQYSLAVTYCHLRGGRLPFTGTQAQIMAGHCHREPELSMLPEAERPIVARAMAKEPKGRWPNCRAFVEALRAVQADGRPGPGPIPPPRVLPNMTTVGGPAPDQSQVTRLEPEGNVAAGGGAALDAPARRQSGSRVEAGQVADNEIVFAADSGTTLGYILSALERLGTVTGKDPEKQSVLGKVRYGLQSVKVRASVAEDEPGRSRVVIQASSDDVWGAGARSATKRLVEVVRNLNTPGYQPDRLGINPAALIGMLLAFAILTSVIASWLVQLIRSFTKP